MSESLYRRKLDQGIIDILQGRRNLLDQPQTGGKSPSVRNPCYIYVTGHDKSCGGGGSKTYPSSETTMDDTYYSGGSIKPGPDLDSVTIEYGGETGLAMSIAGTIRCYTLADFTRVQRYFLLPGNEIDVRFGYKKTWGIEQPEGKLNGFTVATFAFNTTQEGHWIAEFKAVSAAQAIKNLDMQIVVCNGCSGGSGQSGNSGPLVYFTGIDNTKHPVKGVAQLIAADAQQNGVYSIDDMQDGEVVTKFENYQPGSEDKSAAIVVYHGDHIRDTMDKFMAWAGGIAKDLGFGKSEVEAANNQVYVTLGYIVNRIINDQLLRAMSCGVINDNGDRDRFSLLKVEFHDEFSKCKIAQGITSGDPLSVLLLGDANYKNSSGEGKDFDADCKYLGAVKSNSSGDIKLQNILVHRDVVVAAFQTATKNRQSEAEQTDIKDSKEEVINIIDFFEKISDQISQAVGGAINLRLVEHPTNMKKLIVVDQNYGVVSSLPCVVFNPIDGDGSTRTCQVQSNVGSEEYKAAMFVGSSKRGDAVSALRKCADKLKDKRQEEYSKAKTDKDAIIKSPGNLGKNYFNGQEINALKSVMGRLHRNNPETGTNESVHYPGSSISLEIDGLFGFIPGNAISTSQLPKEWRKSPINSYYMVRKVTHNFSNSDWKTNIEGILAYYPNINYIPL